MSELFDLVATQDRINAEFPNRKISVTRIDGEFGWKVQLATNGEEYAHFIHVSDFTPGSYAMPELYRHVKEKIERHIYFIENEGVESEPATKGAT